MTEKSARRKTSPYYFGTYTDWVWLDAKKPYETRRRGAMRELDTAKRLGLNFVSLCGPDTAKDGRMAFHQMRESSRRGLKFMLQLDFPTTTFDAGFIRELRRDKSLDAHFLGLFRWEFNFPDFGTDRIEHWPGETLWMDLTKNLHTGKAFPKQIENPYEAYACWRQVLGEYLKPLREAMGEGRFCWWVDWAGLTRRTRQFGGYDMSGFHGLKFAMGAAGCKEFGYLPEYNGREYSPALAEARGIGRTNGSPYGVGPCPWRYYHWVRDVKCEAKHLIKDKVAGHEPGYVYFLPSIVSWAGGGTTYAYEQLCLHDQWKPSKAAIDGFRTFRKFTRENPVPMRPDIRIAFMKGQGYFGWSLPWYKESGIGEEIFSWTQQTMFSVFYPRLRAGEEWYQTAFSGTPYGDMDIIPWYASPDVLKNYDVIVLFEWNTMDDELMTKLRDYVRAGGILIANGAHYLAKKEGIVSWATPHAEEFYRAGHVEDFCGLELGGYSYMYTLHPVRRGIIRHTAVKDRIFKRRQYGETLGLFPYPVKLAGGEVVHEANGTPITVRHRVGQGTVYTVLSCSYENGLRQALGPFFREIARFVESKLAFEVRGLSPDEREDLIAYADTAKAGRFVAINYWDRRTLNFEILPRTCEGKKDQRIRVWSSTGKMADTRSRRLTLRLPPMSIAVIEPSHPQEQ